MGEASNPALRVDFDRAIKRQFRGATVSSDAGLFAYRELDHAAELTESAAAEMSDPRTGNNIRHSIPALLREDDVAIRPGTSIRCSGAAGRMPNGKSRAIGFAGQIPKQGRR